jgi:hypothetical protein
MYITRLASNEIFSPSKKIHHDVGGDKDLSAPRHSIAALSTSSPNLLGSFKHLIPISRGGTVGGGM